MTWDLENGLLKAIDIKLEIWKSSENQEEHHYFLMDKPSGHELYTYAFGINPKLFGPDKVRQILEMLNETGPKTRSRGSYHGAPTKAPGG